MNPRKFENIIFDLGNTLCYFDFCYFFEGLGRLEKRLNIREFRKYIIANKLDIKLTIAKITHKEFFKKLKRKFDLKIGYSDFAFLYKDIFWENTPMKNFLEQTAYSGKYKLYLVSNSCPVHINFINKNFPYVNLIKNKIYSFRIKMMKPDKKLFKYIIQKYKLNPEKTVFIDDLITNIKIAREFNLKTIHYTSHRSFQRQFNKLIR